MECVGNQRAIPLFRRACQLLQLFDADVSEAVEFALFAMVLEPDVSRGIDLVGVVGAEDAIDPDADAVAFDVNFILIPVVALERTLGLFAEGIAGRGVVRFFRVEPTAAAFVVEAARPGTDIGIDLGLVAVGPVGFDVAAEEKPGVGLAFRHLDFRLEDKVGIGFLRAEEKLFAGNKVDFAVNYAGFTPLVGVVPAIKRFAVEKRDPIITCSVC